MKLTIEITTDNDAFGDVDSDDGQREVGRIIRKAQDRFRPGGSGMLHDSNGNTVGSWAWR